MASNRETETRVGYPKLTADQLNLIIDQLLFVMRQRDLGTDTELAGQTFAALTNFYAKRWGLPPCIARHDIAASFGRGT